jgi:hypothetical protein
LLEESTKEARIVVDVMPSAGNDAVSALRPMDAVIPGPLDPPGLPDSPHPISINARKLTRRIRKVIFAYVCLMEYFLSLIMWLYFQFKNLLFDIHQVFLFQLNDFGRHENQQFLLFGFVISSFKHPAQQRNIL